MPREGRGRFAIRTTRLERAAERERRNIDQRSFEFAAAVVRLARSLPENVPAHVVSRVVQIGTDVGAFVDEAKRSTSRRRHLANMTAARRECGRIDYWLRLLAAAEAVPAETVEPFLAEAQYLFALLTDICIYARQHLPQGEPHED